jgi:hypothetical protein
MDFVGLTTRYKVNRPLTWRDIELHLLQNEDIADKRKGYLDALQRHVDDMKDWGFLVVVFFFWFVPTCVFYSIGRWIATHTSRIPKWPEEIVAKCQIDPGDIYHGFAQLASGQ